MAERLLLLKREQARRAGQRNLIVWSALHLSHRLTTYNPDSRPRFGLSDFQRELCSTLDGMVQRRGVRRCNLAPRGNSKTTFATLAYPLREALEGRESYILLVGDTQTSSRLFLDNIKRELETNRTIRQYYPEVAGPGPIWNQDVIRLRNGVEVEAISTGAAIRGRVKLTRPTLIICDDLQGRDDIISPTLRRQAWDWFVGDLLPMGEPSTNVIVNATAIHRDCIAYKLQATAGWETRLYRALIEAPERTDLWDQWERILHDNEPDAIARARAFYESNQADMDTGAVVLWPERFPLYDLMLKLVSSGPAAFASEENNNPVNPEALEWPEDYFDEKARPELRFDDWPEHLGGRVLYLDPAKGAKNKLGDYACYVRFGWEGASGVEYYEADLFRGSAEATLSAIIERGIRHVREFKPDVFAFESIGSQNLYGTLLRKALDEQRLDVVLWAMEDTTDKDVRIRRLDRPLAQRKARFRRTKGTDMLLEQLRDFPTHERRDGPDAAEGARRAGLRLREGKVRGPQGVTQFRA